MGRSKGTNTRNENMHYRNTKHTYGNLIAIRNEGNGLEEGIYPANTIKEVYTLLHDGPGDTKQTDENSIQHLTAWIKIQMENGTLEKIVWISNKEMTVDTSTYERIKSQIMTSIKSSGNRH